MSTLPKSIYDLFDLEQFRKRPAMYMGSGSITVLRTYVHGYFYAIDANDIEIEDPVRFEEFHDWVADYFGWRESTAGWANIILHECDGDEQGGLQTFFELYDQFKKRDLSKRPMRTTRALPNRHDIEELNNILASSIKNNKAITIRIYSGIPGTALQIHQSGSMSHYGIGKSDEMGFTLYISVSNRSKGARNVKEELIRRNSLKEFNPFGNNISDVYIHDFKADVALLVDKTYQILNDLKSLSHKEPYLVVFDET